MESLDFPFAGLTDFHGISAEVFPLFMLLAKYLYNRHWICLQMLVFY